jgi:deferrochelatase/peroxidase EfeB
MALKDLLKAPLDKIQADAQTFMERVQGNILKGHDRFHTAHLFVRFGADVAAVRAWIAGDMSRRLTSAKQQAAYTEAWHKAGGVGHPFFAFFLSSQGYAALGVDAASTPNDPYFRTGMKSTPTGVPATVTDPPVSEWEENFRGRLDAMILVADDDRGRLDQIVKELTKELASMSGRLFVERGDQQIFDFGGGRDKVEIEHFGHQDGISQPRMVKQDANAELCERGGASIGIRPLHSILLASKSQVGLINLEAIWYSASSGKTSKRFARRGTDWLRCSGSVSRTPLHSPSGVTATGARCCRRRS